MSKLEPLALAAAAMLLGGAVLAQTAPPAPSNPMEKPPAASPAPAPQAKSSAPGTHAKSAAAAATQPTTGMPVFSSDGNRIDNVRAVKKDPAGRVTALYVRTGGFLGFGGKIVEIPESKFIVDGRNVRLNVTNDEVRKLPAAKDAI
jgi:hypothetical protein